MADGVEETKAEPVMQDAPGEEQKAAANAAGDGLVDGPGANADGAEGQEGEGEPKPEAPKLRMDFVFGDEKKKKKAKKQKPKPPKRLTRLQYETIICDLHAVLADLRRTALRLGRVNFANNKKLVDAHEMDMEVSEHLKRVQKKRLETVTIEESYQLEIIKKRKELDIESKARIKEIQNQYTQNEKQFLGEIEMLRYKFRTLCLFVEGGDTTLEKMANIENEYKECERKFRDRLYEVQKKNVVLRNITDNEAKRRFQRIIDDFSRSREVRNAAYTRRLLSENSDLRRKYNKLIPIYLNKEGKLTNLMENTKIVKETHLLLSDMIKQLENTQVKRDELLKKLHRNYNIYKLQIVASSKFHRMYQAVQEYELKESKKYKNKDVLFEDIAEHTIVLHEKYRALKEAENDYLFQRHKYDLFVDSVKDAAFSLCGLDEYEHLFPKSFDEYVAKRDGIVRGLIELTTNVENPQLSEAMLEAKYFIGYLGFMPLEFAINTILEKEESVYEDLNIEMSIEESDPAMQCVK